MTIVMISNIIIKVAWIVGMIYLIINGHPYWAGACFFGALVSGYSLNSDCSAS